MINVSEARQIITHHVKPSRGREVPILDALHFVLKEDISADRDYPPFNRATMDGFAISSNDFNNSSDKKFFIYGEVFAGEMMNHSVDKGCAVKIMTGAPVPEGLDAVVMIEDCRIVGKDVQIDIEKVTPWMNISRQGEDALKGDILLTDGTICDVSVLSLLATLGQEQVYIYDIPLIAIISTGDEVVSPGQPIKPYQIRNSNLYTIQAFLKDYNIIPNYVKHVPDNKEMLYDAIQEGLKRDVLILTGGVSMGDADFVPEVLDRLGVQKLFHKVKIKPGKPIWFGETDHGVVFGLPGNPMSCQVCFKVFIELYIRHFMGLKDILPVQLEISTNRSKKGMREDYFPCKLGSDYLIVEPIRYNGSGDIKSCLHSDGIAIHPGEVQELKRGDVVDFIPWRSL